MLKQIRNFSPLHRALVIAAVQKELVKVLPTSFEQKSTRQLTTDSAKKWDLLSAVCLERHPVITKPKNDLESKFHQMLQQVEFERSMKSDHEIRIENEQKLLHNTENQEDDAKVDIITKQTAQDFEDACEEELKQFQFASRTTDDSVTSVERKLDKNLVLLVEQKLGEKSYWIPPQSARQDGETMKQAADRTLREFCGTSIRAQFYGNAPIGFYKYKYPRKLNNEGRYGAKVFYFLAKYVDGEVGPNVKYRWLDRTELQETLPSGICKSVTQFLLPE